jgi:hypothetical protein
VIHYIAQRALGLHFYVLHKEQEEVAAFSQPRRIDFEGGLKGGRKNALMDHAVGIVTSP